MNDQGYTKKSIFLYVLIVGVAVDSRPQRSVGGSGLKCSVDGKSGR